MAVLGFHNDQYVANLSETATEKVMRYKSEVSGFYPSKIFVKNMFYLVIFVY